MFVTSEEELEDYICENIDGFIDFLNDIWQSSKIEFIGRQIEIANSRIDLLFRTKWENEEKDFKRYSFLVVELKYRKAEPKDLAQISRYINLIRDLENELNKKYNSNEITVDGLLLTMGSNSEMQEIQMNLKYEGINVYFASYQTELFYEFENYSRKEEFVKQMTYDKRFLLEEDINNGKEEDDIA